MARFADRNWFASRPAPPPSTPPPANRSGTASPRAGNRRLNHVLYIAAIVQIRHDTPGRAYYRRKIAEGKTPLEALRCLRRRLSDVVYRQLVTDAAALRAAADQAGPGGHPGTATDHSSVADPTPTAGSSDRPVRHEVARCEWTMWMEGRVIDCMVPG